VNIFGILIRANIDKTIEKYKKLMFDSCGSCGSVHTLARLIEPKWIIALTKERGQSEVEINKLL